MTFTKAEQYIIDTSPELGTVIEQNGTITHQAHTDYFEALATAIVSQQISVKAAAKIFERFKTATHLEPTTIVALNEDEIKAIGLSGQKSRYLHDLAEHFIRDSTVFNHLDSLSNDEVIAELTKVKGIGVWTAQMFLMFTLVRPDVFAPDDRGLQLAITQLFELSNVPSRSELEDIAQQWAPYRTTASWHLWRLLDNEPVQ